MHVDDDGDSCTVSPQKPRSQVDLVVDAVMERATRGLLLPGDRLVEAELARDLKVGRMAVRDAIRLLEGQGILVGTPGRSTRLMDVGVDRLRKILKVRLVLEKLAVAELRAAAAAGDDVFFPLAEIVERMRAAASIGDHYAIARIDTEFHRTLVELSGNMTLVHAWEQLAGQLTIIFGLSALQKRLPPIVEEHEMVLRLLRSGSDTELDRAMELHLLDNIFALDHTRFVERQRMFERRVPA
jgi:DNA-binding GntR family transcriptional regulator